MRRFNSFGSLAHFLRSQAVPTYRHNIKQSLERVGDETAKEVRQKVGVLQPSIGRFNAWAPLSAATIDRKTKQGLGKGGNAASPLYASGAFENDISFRVVSTKYLVFVGTNKEYMKNHEYGSSKNPPRPIFGPAAETVLPKMIPVIQMAGMNGIGGALWKY